MIWCDPTAQYGNIIGDEGMVVEVTIAIVW